ncbi:MAG: hypothetical protein JW797_15310 [Bradymonadales bacterium]|nr:hypothetical protein [Bradymonadales bacterium]
MKSYGVRVLNPKDKQAILDFLAQADPYSTLLMRGPARDFDQFLGYWMGALADGTKLEALACVEGLATNIYAKETEAADAMGWELRRRATSMKPLPGVHQMVGDERTIDAFWNIFSQARLRVVFDRKRQLFCATPPIPPPETPLSVHKALASDLKAVYEYTAMQATEMWGIDPRKTAQQKAHEEHCAKAIQEERQLIVRDGGKPVLVAEIVRPDEATVMLDRIYVTIPYKARGKLVTSALLGLVQVAIQGVPEVLFFVESNDKLLSGCTVKAGFSKKTDYRLIVMRV